MTNPSESNTQSRKGRRMIIAAAILLIIVAAGTAWYFLFPKNVIAFIGTPGGRTLEISHSGFGLKPAPDHFATNGFAHIETYIARLMASTEPRKGLIIMSEDKERGLVLIMRSGTPYALLDADWRKEPEREARIRSFFKDLNIAPTKDYLAGNGLVPDATRFLEYPLAGNVQEVTALTKRVLHDIYAISPEAGLFFD